MSRETQNIVVLLIGLSTGLIAVKGSYLNFVKPSLFPWLVAAAVFEHFTGHDIDVSLAVDGKWVSPNFLRAVFKYVFCQLTCRRISCEIAGQNTAMRHIAGRLGFKDEGVKRDAVPGDNLVMMGMLRSECRFL